MSIKWFLKYEPNQLTDRPNPLLFFLNTDVILSEEWCKCVIEVTRVARGRTKSSNIAIKDLRKYSFWVTSLPPPLTSSPFAPTLPVLRLLWPSLGCLSLALPCLSHVSENPQFPNAYRSCLSKLPMHSKSRSRFSQEGWSSSLGRWKLACYMGQLPMISEPSVSRYGWGRVRSTRFLPNCIFFPFFLFFFLAVLHGIWDPSILTRDSNPGPLRWKCSILTTGHQEIPCMLSFLMKLWQNMFMEVYSA